MTHARLETPSGFTNAFFHLVFSTSFALFSFWFCFIAQTKELVQSGGSLG